MPQQAINTTLTQYITLKATSCYCGVAYAVEENFLRNQRDTGGEIFCPLGHRGVFGKTTENERLRQQLADAETARVRLRERIEAEERYRKQAERSARALRGQVTKAKKRVAAGVCPVADCHRHFEALDRHMKTKHPDYAGQEIG